MLPFSRVSGFPRMSTHAPTTPMGPSSLAQGDGQFPRGNTG